MSTETAPAFQFYPSDFLSDINVIAMPTTAVGAYILLLSVCWKECILPDDADTLSSIAKLQKDEFLLLWDRYICKCFVKTDEGYRHKRHDSEREKQAELRRIRAESGKLGGRPKGSGKDEKQKKANGKQMVSKTEAKKSSSTSTSTSTSIGIPNGIPVPEAFKAEYEGWLRWRRESKLKPLKPKSIEEQIRFLSEQPDPAECIRQSIRNGWQGLFASKAERRNGRAEPDYSSVPEGRDL